MNYQNQKTVGATQLGFHLEVSNCGRGTATAIDKDWQRYKSPVVTDFLQDREDCPAKKARVRSTKPKAQIKREKDDKSIKEIAALAKMRETFTKAGLSVPAAYAI
jgi:hypothetical protein